MKNIKLSILVVIITIVTVGIMSMDANLLQKVKEDKSIVQVPETINPEVDIKDKGSTEEVEEPKDSEEITNKIDENQAPEEEKKNTSKDTGNAEGDSDKKSGGGGRYQEKDKPSPSYTAPVFKVDKTTIPSKLTFQDKKVLLSIAKKLSMMDYANIVDIMQSSEEMKSAAEIFGILQLRLQRDDYQQVVEILSPYLYIDNIEKNISW